MTGSSLAWCVWRASDDEPWRAASWDRYDRIFSRVVRLESVDSLLTRARLRPASDESRFTSTLVCIAQAEEQVVMTFAASSSTTAPSSRATTSFIRAGEPGRA